MVILAPKIRALILVIFVHGNAVAGAKLPYVVGPEQSEENQNYCSTIFSLSHQGPILPKINDHLGFKIKLASSVVFCEYIDTMRTYFNTR